MSTRSIWPAELARYRDFFSDYTAQDHRRPAGQYPHHRALSAARGRSAGPEIQEQPEALADQPGASTLIVEVTEKPIDALARIDNRGTDARGPLEYLGQRDRQQPAARRTRRSPLTYAGTFQLEELQYSRGDLPAGAQQRRPDRASSTRSYGFGRPGTAMLRRSTTRPRATVRRGGPDLSGDPLARDAT